MLSFWNKRRSRAGFTLVEVLAVLLVIAILLGMTLAAAQYVIKVARKNRAQVTAAALQVALATYRHEYNMWPVGGLPVSANNVVTASGVNNASVFGSLRASAGETNIKKIQFLDETTVFTYVAGQGFKTLNQMADVTPFPIAYMDRKGNVQYYTVIIDMDNDTVAVTLPSI